MINKIKRIEKTKSGQVNVIFEKDEHLTQAELLLQQAKVIVDLEKKQQAQEVEIQRLSEESEEMHEELKRMKSKVNNTTDFYSVMGFCYMKGISINFEDSEQLEKEASEICKANGISTGSFVHHRLGRVETYPYNVLKSVVESKTSKVVKLN